MRISYLLTTLLVLGTLAFGCKKTEIEEEESSPWAALAGTWVGECDWETWDSSGTSMGSFPDTLRLEALGDPGFNLLLNSTTLFQHQSGMDLSADTVWFANDVYNQTRFGFVENGSRMVGSYQVAQTDYSHEQMCEYVKMNP